MYLHLEQVMTGIQEATEMMDSIARASQEQADAISQITVGIDQISSVVQTNSATSQESAAASEELSSQAQIMKELVRRFKLEGDSGAASGVSQYDYSSADSQPVSYASYGDDGKY